MRRPRRAGFTLIELLVVLALLSLAAALAAPAILARRPARSAMSSLIPVARDVAARRGETIYLRIAGSGEWRLEGTASSAGGPLAMGRVDPFPGLPLTLMISPLGSCAFDLRSASAANTIRLNPLTCGVSP